MSVKYVIDDSGKKSAVIVPLKEWKSIMVKIKTFQEDLEVLSPEDALERDQAYHELERGDALNLQEAMRDW